MSKEKNKEFKSANGEESLEIKINECYGICEPKIKLIFKDAFCTISWWGRIKLCLFILRTGVVLGNDSISFNLETASKFVNHMSYLVEKEKQAVKIRLETSDKTKLTFS